MSPPGALLCLATATLAGTVRPDVATIAEALAMPAFARGVQILSSVDAVFSEPWLPPLSSRAAAAAINELPARATFDEVSRAIAAAETDIVTQMPCHTTTSVSWHITAVYS
eukprot:1066967-Prymnesium_polylepis.1